MTRIWVAVLLVTAAPGPVAAQDAVSFDNAGVLMGQTVAEATTALERQGFVVNQISGRFDLAPDRPFVGALRATREDDTTSDEVLVRFDEPPSEARSFLVLRSIAFKPGKAPTLESYRATVRTKAGNETYWRDTGLGRVEQYVQWSKSGKPRRGFFDALASLPTSYPNACVVAATMPPADQAAVVRVRAPQYGSIGAGGPAPEPRAITPQEFCATGLLLNYRVPDRATGLVTAVNVQLLDQARAAAMAAKRDKWLDALYAAKVNAAKKAGGKPVL